MKIYSKIACVAALSTAFTYPTIRENLASTNPFSITSEEPDNTVKAKAHPIGVTEEGKKWMEMHELIYQKTKAGEVGGLIDASTFLSSEQRARLDKLVAIQGEFGAVEFTFKKLPAPENGYQYALFVDYDTQEKEKWYISGNPYYSDQFPKGEEWALASLGIWKGTQDGGVDKLTQNLLYYNDLFKANGDFNSDYLIRKIEEAKENRRKEIEDLVQSKTYDLPKNEPIGYIGLASPNIVKDVVFPDAALDVKCFAEMMSHCGYQMVSNDKDNYSIRVTSEPEKIVEDEVKAFLSKGVKVIYIRAADHGNEGGVGFNLGKDENQDENQNDKLVFLTPRELIDLWNKYPECTFIISTNSCSGGGFSDAIKRYQDPTGKEGRITLSTHSKIYGTSQEGRLKGIVGEGDSPKVFSGYFDIPFIHHLTSGKSYGEAHLLADQETKNIMSCDAEIWRSRPTGGISTADLHFNILKRIKFYLQG